LLYPRQQNILAKVDAVVIKGFEKFREKMPALSGKKIVILPIYAICMATLAFVIYLTFDSLPSTLVSWGANEVLLSFFPLIGVAIVEIAGFFLVWQMWFWRDKLKTKYGPKSYQRLFLIGFGGIILVLTVAINQYIPFYSFATNFWSTSPMRILATPLETFLGIASQTVFYIKTGVAAIILLIGLLMCNRAIQTFGFDYMVVLYLFFPEESKIQKNEIYSALRHPTYAGAVLICLGGAFLTFTILSFTAYLIFLAGFYIHIHFIEEKELIQRFGDSYINYRKKVPALFVKPRNMRTFLRFLFERSSNNRQIEDPIFDRD
jgi:protein-S-isoprenylcysteine O-methyltransferase Ste14